MIQVKFTRPLISRKLLRVEKLCVATKPRHESPNDYYICCKLSCKLQYGNSRKSFSTKGEILSQVLEKARIEVERNSNLSERHQNLHQKLQGSSSEEVQRPRVGAGARNSRGMQF